MNNVIVSGVVSHGDSRWGFKLSFLNTTDAIHMKPKIVKLLESEGFIVTTRKGYNE
jgi:hypothetical protein